MSYIGKIPANAVLTTADLADGIVTAAKIEDGTVVAAELASNAVTTAKINADAVTAAKIADNAISEEHLDVTAITGHTAETTVADGDLVVVHDASASALRKMTVANLVANAGGGKLLQVVSVTWKDAFSSTANSGTFAAITGASAAITPSAASSKILVTAMLNTSGSVYGQYIRLLKGGSTIAGALGTVSGSRTAITAYAGTPGDAAEMDTCHINYLDSPSSTSAVTYTLDGSARAATTWTVNYPYEDGDYNYHGHSVSTITLMEIGA